LRLLAAPLGACLAKLVTPLCNENNWLDKWAGLPGWQPPDKPLLVISPHPDDETLAIGGFVASRCLQGVEVIVLAVTDGENAYGTDDSLGEIRRAEQERAGARLGISREKIVRLGFPDSGVETREEELFRRTKALISRDTLLVAPWSQDFHPDHKVCGRVAERVAAEAQLPLASYFFWTWHTNDVRNIQNLPLRRFELKPEWLTAKTRALAEHRSQLVRPNAAPILSEDLLWPARQACEVFLLS